MENQPEESHVLDLGDRGARINELHLMLESLDFDINELTKIYVHLNYAQPRITVQSEKASLKIIRALLRKFRTVLRRNDSYVGE